MKKHLISLAIIGVLVSLIITLIGVVAGEEQPTNVTVDATPPTISITSPINNANTTDPNLEITYVVSDENLDSCWWTDDDGETNNPITCGESITGQTWKEAISCIFNPLTCHNNNIIIYANDTTGNINSASVSFLVDTTAPVSTVDMRLGDQEDWNTASAYTNDTWTNQDVSVAIVGIDSGIGLNNLAYPKYCVDTTNTCIPNTYIGMLVTISTKGINYIRYQSVDLLGNVEPIQSRTIKIYEPDLTLTPSPIPLNFGILGPGMSSEKEVTLTPGVTDLDVSVDITGDELMQTIQTDRTGNWASLKGDSFVVLASIPMSFNAKLTIPEEATSNTYNGIIVYTVLEHLS